MSLSDLASIGSLVSGLAVLLSLVYLGLQTRQNTKHARALIHQGRAARFTEILLHMMEFDYTDGFSDFLSGIPNRNAREFQAFYANFRVYMVNGEDSFLQHREGLLDQEAFETFQSGNRTLMQRKGYRMLWNLTRASYGPGFREFMDRAVAEAEAESGPTLFDQWNSAAAQAESPVPV